MSERTNPPGVLLAELIGADRVFAGLAPGDKAALLTELGRIGAAACGLPAEAIRSGLAAREALGSTGIGAGIAVPHARMAGLAAPVGFFARLARAIDFSAVDNVRVDLVFLLLSPVQADSAHLASLAAVARRLRQPKIAQSIRSAGTAAEIRRLLVDSASA